MPTVFISYSWDGPEHRAWVRGLVKQNSIMLVPKEVNICVDLPIKKEYIYNAQDGLVAGLYSDKFVPVLTPLGKKYCMDQLESVLPDVPLQAKDFEPDLEDDDGWDKGETKTTDIDEELGW